MTEKDACNKMSVSKESTVSKGSSIAITNVDKRLKDIMDRDVAIARATFAADEADEENIRNSLLLFLAGSGLAVLDTTKVLSPTWVATDALIQAELDPSVGTAIPADLLRKRPGTAGKPSEARMLPSLRIIISDIFEPAQAILPGSGAPDQSAMDLAR